MSKFNRGDIVLVDMGGDEASQGIVTQPWSWHNVTNTSGEIPLVEVVLLEEGCAGYFNEDDVELAMDEYEFAAIRVDLEDFEQFFLGGTYYDPECWGTLEEAEKLIKEAQNDKHYDEWKEDTQLQINRRRKAGPTIGHKTFKW